MELMQLEIFVAVVEEGTKPKTHPNRARPDENDDVQARLQIPEHQTNGAQFDNR